MVVPAHVGTGVALMLGTHAPRTKACAHCDKPFTPARPMQKVCGPVCARRLTEVRKAKEKQALKERKRALETIPELIKAAQREFNAFIRERDKDQPCICCGEPLHSGEVGGAFDCGHYRSTGSASHLRFDERNAHAQRKHCNRYGAGRAVDYRVGLIARIGREAVEALEADNRVHKWTADELRAIRDTYRAKARELKKGQEA
jgi:hypothetical protein